VPLFHRLSIQSPGRSAGLLLVALLLLVGTPSGRAAPRTETLAAFNTAVAEADAHFRTASHYLRVGAAAPAELELEALDRAWQTILVRFVDAPPEPFASDPKWRDTMTSVSDRVTIAYAAARAGDLTKARATLLPIRAELGALRRRNGVVVFADCLEEIHAALDGYARFREVAPVLDSSADQRALLATTAVLEHLFRRCRDEAPGAVAADAQFQRLVDGALAGLDRMWQAVGQRDLRMAEGTISEIYSFVRLLYLGFG
jgi:hypothetical protein